MFQPNLNKWYILFINRDGKIVEDFLDMLQNISRAIGMRINSPQKVALRDDRNESYLQEIRRNVNSGYELVVAVFPTNRTDRYSALKRSVVFIVALLHALMYIASSISSEHLSLLTDDR